MHSQRNYFFIDKSSYLTTGSAQNICFLWASATCLRASIICPWNDVTSKFIFDSVFSAFWGIFAGVLRRWFCFLWASTTCHRASIICPWNDLTSEFIFDPVFSAFWGILACVLRRSTIKVVISYWIRSSATTDFWICIWYWESRNWNNEYVGTYDLSYA